MAVKRILGAYIFKFRWYRRSAAERNSRLLLPVVTHHAERVATPIGWMSALKKQAGHYLIRLDSCCKTFRIYPAGHPSKQNHKRLQLCGLINDIEPSLHLLHALSFKTSRRVYFTVKLAFTIARRSASK